MTYTVFVEETAAYVAASLDHAKELADPYIGLGRSVAIRHYDDELPPTAWRYDYGRYDWVEFEHRPQDVVAPLDRMPFGRSRR